MLASYTLRLLITGTTSLFRPRAQLVDDLDIPLVAWLSDIDWNGHVNNGRFLTLMDQGRLDHIARTGLMRACFKIGVNAVVANASIKFRREVRPYVRHRLFTRISSWDERRTYFTQRIERDGELCAQAEIALALRYKGRTISLAELLTLAGVGMPEALAALQTSAPKLSA